ncbi:MAG: Unknown protein [uncultured Sulfurovum sp.]|uniref:Helicase n=1 Tax=uncultured Sulfurovum sp. TaxID=269237 RepID=A0A6S6SY03_9BACT|nr:MAG: Unknown protein [uncultured Sulfurovum sp.]
MRYILKAHQQRALSNIALGFNTSNRLQYISACGTGKTLVGYQYTKELLQEANNQTVVLFFPSLALISQTYEAYKSYGLEISKYDILFVCSDESVYEEETLEIGRSVVSFNVTTQEDLISNFLTTKVPGPKKNKLIFCTYQSSKTLANGFLDAKSNIDFAVYDEAHKTASINDSYFNYTLDNENLSIDKRLFMTATPKHKSVLQYENEEAYLYSMTNTSRYGEVVEKYTVREAINDKVISPYKIIVSIVSDEEIDRIRAKNTSTVLKNMELKKAAKIIALSKAVEKYSIKKGLVFTERIARSKEYTLAYDELNTGVNVHLDSKKSTKQINDTFQHFTRASKGMIFNAKLLSEGIDVPTVDLVAFMEKTESSINIAQRIGRATRLDKNNPNKIGYIFIPIFLSTKDEDIFTAAQKSGDFSEMLEIINVMAEQDETLNSIFNKARSHPKEAQKALSDLIVIDEYSNRFDISKREYLQEKISAYALEGIGSSWDKNYEVLKEYYEEFEKLPRNRMVQYKMINLGEWIRQQRSLFLRNKLSKDRIQHLDKIDMSWKINLFNDAWDKNYEVLKEYYEKFGKFPSSSHENIKLKKIGIWILAQKTNYNKNNISAERVELLDKIDVSWKISKKESDEVIWRSSYSLLKAYFEEFGHFPSAKNKDLKIRQLGTWILGQKKNYNKNNISAERVELLDKIDVSWKISKKELDEVVWHSSYSLLKAYFEEFEKLPSHNTIYRETKLGLWLSNQKTNYNKNNISAERIKLLDEIDPSWKIAKKELDEAWHSIYSLLKAYVKEFEKLPSHNTIYKEKRLGIWFFHQRTNYNKNNISAERIELLDEIDPSWKENRIEQKWLEHYSQLKEYFDNFNQIPPAKATYEGFKIGYWLGTQKTNYNKNNISAERIKLLDEIDPSWKISKKESDEVVWRSSYSLLKAYVKEFEKLPSHNTIYRETKLGLWLSNQKTNYNKNNISAERIELLDEIDPSWKVIKNSKSNKTWEENYTLLKAYLEEFGKLPKHNTIYRETKLGMWLKTSQTRKYQNSCLSSERIKLLDEIDPSWKISKKELDEVVWGSSYPLLKAYFEEFGYFPSAKNKDLKIRQLGTWILGQKKNYNKNNISAERIKLLDEIDPSWKISKKEKIKATWMDNYNLLMKYYKEFGEAPPQRTIYENIKIGVWLDNERKKYEKGKLPLELKNVFASTDIPWLGTLEHRWKERYLSLKTYHEEFGHFPSAKNKDSKIRQLGSWLGTQKTNYNKNNISAERIKLLDKIDESWKVREI